MLNEKDRNLLEIGRMLQKMFPDYYGSIQFNLKPGRKFVNVNLVESKMLEEGKENK